MRLEFCNKKINFGDTLNEWLWPKVINKQFNNNDTSVFLGIGTIITQKRIKKIESTEAKKIILLSSGCWGSEEIALNKETWKFYGVRGPRTAKALGLTENAIIGDGASLLRNFYPKSHRKSGVIGFIPHHGSEFFLHWGDVCEKAGLKYISPQQHPESFINELQECEYIITEAMHGAIAADALRIQWKAVSFSPSFSAFKWYDWAEALNIRLSIHDIPFVISKRIPANRMFEYFLKYYLNIIFPSKKSDRINVYKEKINSNTTASLIQKLIELKESDFQLSTEEDLNRIFNKLNAAVHELNDDIQNGLID